MHTSTTAHGRERQQPNRNERSKGFTCVSEARSSCTMPPTTSCALAWQIARQACVFLNPKSECSGTRTSVFLLGDTFLVKQNRYWENYGKDREMGAGTLLQYTRGLGFWIKPVLERRSRMLSLSNTTITHIICYAIVNLQFLMKIICMILSENFFSPVASSSHCNELFEIKKIVLWDCIESQLVSWILSFVCIFLQYILLGSVWKKSPGFLNPFEDVFFF